MLVARGTNTGFGRGVAPRRVLHHTFFLAPAAWLRQCHNMSRLNTQQCEVNCIYCVHLQWIGQIIGYIQTPERLFTLGVGVTQH